MFFIRTLIWISASMFLLRFVR